MIDMILTGYADEVHRRAVRAEAWAEGETKGREKGREEGREEGKAEGKVEGRNEINELNACLIRDNRMEDLARAVTDSQFQQQLLEEYGI